MYSFGANISAAPASKGGRTSGAGLAPNTEPQLMEKENFSNHLRGSLCPPPGLTTAVYDYDMEGQEEEGLEEQQKEQLGTEGPPTTVDLTADSPMELEEEQLKETSRPEETPTAVSLAQAVPMKLEEQKEMSDGEAAPTTVPLEEDSPMELEEKLKESSGAEDSPTTEDLQADAPMELEEEPAVEPMECAPAHFQTPEPVSQKARERQLRSGRKRRTGSLDDSAVLDDLRFRSLPVQLPPLAPEDPAAVAPEPSSSLPSAQQAAPVSSTTRSPMEKSASSSALSSSSLSDGPLMLRAEASYVNRPARLSRETLELNEQFERMPTLEQLQRDREMRRGQGMEKSEQEDEELEKKRDEAKQRRFEEMAREERERRRAVEEGRDPETLQRQAESRRDREQRREERRQATWAAANSRGRPTSTGPTTGTVASKSSHLAQLHPGDLLVCIKAHFQARSVGQETRLGEMFVPFLPPVDGIITAPPRPVLPTGWNERQEQAAVRKEANFAAIAERTRLLRERHRPPPPLEEQLRMERDIGKKQELRRALEQLKTPSRKRPSPEPVCPPPVPKKTRPYVPAPTPTRTASKFEDAAARRKAHFAAIGQKAKEMRLKHSRQEEGLECRRGSEEEEQPLEAVAGLAELREEAEEEGWLAPLPDDSSPMGDVSRSPEMSAADEEEETVAHTIRAPSTGSSRTRSPSPHTARPPTPVVVPAVPLLPAAVAVVRPAPKRRNPRLPLNPGRDRPPTRSVAAPAVPPPARPLPPAVALPPRDAAQARTFLLSIPAYAEAMRGRVLDRDNDVPLREKKDDLEMVTHLQRITTTANRLARATLPDAELLQKATRLFSLVEKRRTSWQ